MILNLKELLHLFRSFDRLFICGQTSFCFCSDFIKEKILSSKCGFQCKNINQSPSQHPIDSQPTQYLLQKRKLPSNLLVVSCRTKRKSITQCHAGRRIFPFGPPQKHFLLHSSFSAEVVEQPQSSGLNLRMFEFKFPFNSSSRGGDEAVREKAAGQSGWSISYD